MATFDDRKRRAARVQALIRDVNERVVGGIDATAVNGAGIDLLCECYDRECVEVISLSRPEYETIRQNPRRFPVRRGHVLLEIERVVESHSRYEVVEKFGDAGDLVAEGRPRTSP